MSQDLESRLIDIVRATPTTWAVLETARGKN